MGVAGKSIIVLCRSNLWTNRYRKFKVLIDGRKEGAIARGQRESYTVTPGLHNIQVRLDWYKSDPLELDLVEGEEVRLECGPRTGISAELNAIVSPGGALYVKAADETVSGSQEGVWSKIVTLADQKLAEYSDAHTSEHQLETRPTGIHLFISYRREDSPDVCGRIYDRLIQQFGKEAVFKDVDSIPFGVDFRTYLEEVVSKCAIMLAIIGDGWLDISGPEGKSRLFDPRDYVRIRTSRFHQAVDVPKWFANSA